MAETPRPAAEKKKRKRQQAHVPHNALKTIGLRSASARICYTQVTRGGVADKQRSKRQRRHCCFPSRIFVKCKFLVIECKEVEGEEEPGFVEASKPAMMQQAGVNDMVRTRDCRSRTWMDEHTTTSLQPALFCFFVRSLTTLLAHFSFVVVSAYVGLTVHASLFPSPPSHYLVSCQSLLPQYGPGEACLIMQVCTIVLGKGAAFPLSL